MNDEEIKELCIRAIQAYLRDSKYTNDYIIKTFPTALKLAISNAKTIMTREQGATMIMKGQHMVSYSASIKVKIVDDNVKLLLPIRKANFKVW